MSSERLASATSKGMCVQARSWSTCKPVHFDYGECREHSLTFVLFILYAQQPTFAWTKKVKGCTPLIVACVQNEGHKLFACRLWEARDYGNAHAGANAIVVAYSRRGGINPLGASYHYEVNHIGVT